ANARNGWQEKTGCIKAKRRPWEKAAIQSKTLAGHKELERDPYRPRRKENQATRGKMNSDITGTEPKTALDAINFGDAVTSPSSTFTEYLLIGFRVTRLRALIAANEIEATAAALAGGLIDAECALAMLDEAGLLPLVEASS